MDFWGLLTQALRIAYATLRTPWNFTCKKKFAYATLTQKLTQPYETQAICNLNVFATAYAKLTQSLTQAYERIEIYILFSWIFEVRLRRPCESLTQPDERHGILYA